MHYSDYVEHNSTAGFDSDQREKKVVFLHDERQSYGIPSQHSERDGRRQYLYFGHVQKPNALPEPQSTPQDNEEV
jgi:hypothetical protein